MNTRFLNFLMWLPFIFTKLMWQNQGWWLWGRMMGTSDAMPLACPVQQVHGLLGLHQYTNLSWATMALTLSLWPPNKQRIIMQSSGRKDRWVAEKLWRKLLLFSLYLILYLQVPGLSDSVKYTQEKRREKANSIFGYCFKPNITQRDAASDISGIGHLFNRSTTLLWARFFDLAILTGNGIELARTLSKKINFSDAIGPQIQMDGPTFRKWTSLSPKVCSLFLAQPKMHPSVCRLLQCFQDFLNLIEHDEEVTIERCFLLEVLFFYFFYLIFYFNIL